jgi:hypothetical protein
VSELGLGSLAGLAPQAFADAVLSTRTLPASTSYPITSRIGATGELYTDSITLIAQDTGQAYRLVIVGGAVTLQAVPTVADIRAGFATVTSVTQAVATVAALRRWGY